METQTLDPSVLEKLYRSGAWLCLAIVLVFFVLKYLSASSGVVGTWLRAPGRAHYVTALVAALATLIVPASQGTTPNTSMVFAAFGTMIALILPGAPVKSDPPAELPRASIVSPMSTVKSGVIVTLVALAIGGVFAGAGCAWFKKDIQPALITCAEENATSIAALTLTLKSDVPDWGKVEADAIAAIPAYGYKVAGCVVASLVQTYMTAPESPASSSSNARRVFEHFRANHAGNATFRLNGMDL